MIENVIIIGGGPAGLAAAIYLARANLKPLLLAGSPPGGQLTLTSEVENYPGFESILGSELIEKMRKQAIKFGTQIINENVQSVEFSNKSNESHKTHLTNKTYESKSIIIATGAKALWLGLESETRLRGKGVSACATCDGFFFRNKTVAVVGGGDTALEEALTLTKFAEKVYIIHRRDFFRASKIMQERVLKNEKIEVIWNSAVEEILGEKHVEAVKISQSQLNQSSQSSRLNRSESVESVTNLTGSTDLTDLTLRVDGVFIAIGHKPDTDLFKDKIELDKKGYIMTSVGKALENSKFLINLISNQAPNPNNQKNKELGIRNYDLSYQSVTSVSGVFAAGDCVDHIYRQAATASGMGVATALEAERWLYEI